MIDLRKLSRREALALAALAPFVGTAAATAARPLDVPYVPTAPELVEKMLDLADVHAGDFLIDLGCGDGRIAVAAGRRGAHALGVDLDPDRIDEAVTAAHYAGLDNLVRFRRQDLFATALADATVVTLYLLPQVNLQLRPRLLTELRPGARVVSHNFDMADWRPDTDERYEEGRIMLWTVPATAGGSWTLTDRAGTIYALELDQRFQDLTGTMTGGGQALEIGHGLIRGRDLSFTAAGHAWNGRIEDEGITSEDGWHAVRSDAG